MKLGIEGFHAIITGGTRGIGKAIVETLLKEGCNVSYCARSVTGDEYAAFDGALEAGVTARGRAAGTAVDVSKTEQIGPWVAAAAAAFGRLDIVISNASTFSSDWQASLTGDVLACVELVERARPLLAAAAAPAVLVTGSLAQREAFVFARPGVVPADAPGASPYGSAKAALAQYANATAHILGPLNIRVNVIAPGLIMFPGSPWDYYQTNFPAETAAYQQKIALGPARWGTPQECADVAVFLCSPRAGYVSGASVQITGAFHVATQF